MKKAPNEIDRHVGTRVRARRLMIGMSQEKLGDALGLTFQQVQKYEKGTNRISASRLQHIAGILGVTIEYLYEGATGGGAIPGFADGAQPSYMADDLTAEALKLVRAFNRIREPRVRRKLLDLATTLADVDQDGGKPAGPGRSE